MRRLLSLILVSALTLLGQSAPARKKVPAKPATAPARTSYPIESITLKGLKAFPPESVLAVMGLAKGQAAGKPDFEAAREKLLATGNFDDISYRYQGSANGNGYDVTYDIREVPQRYSVKFEDLAVSEKALDEALRKKDPLFQGKVSATPTAISRASKLMQEVLHAQGQNVKLTSRLQPESGGELVLLFRPEGARPNIAEVDFTGSKVLSQTDLRAAVATAAVGIPYQEERLREVLDASIRPLYEKRGYVRARFTKFETKPAANVQGLAVTVTVDEGKPFQLKEVQLEGPVANREQLRRLGEFKEGQVFDGDTLSAGMDKIAHALKRKGFLNVQMTSNRMIQDKTQTVVVIVKAEPGPQYNFGKLDVQGLDILSEPVIRKLWAMKPGAPFDADYPAVFLDRIRAEAMFDNLGDTRSEVHRNDTEHTADVVLIFTGSPQRPSASKD